MMEYLALTIVNKDPLPQVTNSQNSVTVILNIAFVIIGALAFLMLVIAGFRYVLYGSDPAKLVEVKKQILYALLGLIIVILAATIVNFVISGVRS